MTYNYKSSIIILHIIFWALISILPFSLMSFEDLNNIPNNIFLRIMVGPIFFYTNYLFLIPELLLKKRIYAYILSSIIFLWIFNYIGINALPLDGLNNLSSIKLPEGKNLFFNKLKYFLPATLSLSFFLLGGVFRLIIDFYKRDRETKKMEAERKEVELQFLKAQLSPHFLFNSLNSIYSLVSSKSNDAPEAIITLSELMRYMLYEISENKVLLEKELNYIKNYISLQRLRLSDSENVKLNIYGASKSLKIHPLILITFIENAFKYGTDYKGNTHINIVIKIENTELFLMVENIIGKHTKDNKNSGIGLKNIGNQLTYLYQNNYKLNITNDNGFYKTELSLNLK